MGRTKLELARLRSLETITMINHIRNTSFALGDILVKRYVAPDARGNKSFYYEKYDNSNAAVRFKVVHIDQGNIPYIQQIDLKGKPEGDLFIPFEFDVYDGDEDEPGSYSTYEVDPLFVEATIVGQEFDLVGFLKDIETRLKDIEKANKKAAITPNDLASANAFFTKLTKNSTFYSQLHSYGSEPRLHEVVSIRKLNIKKLTKHSLARHYVESFLGKDRKNDSIVCEIKFKDGRKMFSSQFLNQHLYYSKPLSGEES